MPADQVTTELTYRWGGMERRFTPEIYLRSEYVWEQDRFVPQQDFLEPPEAYLLLHGGIRARWRLGADRVLHTELRIDNALDRRYRDYLNRQRYYADEPGRDVRLRLRLEF